MEEAILDLGGRVNETGTGASWGKGACLIRRGRDRQWAQNSDSQNGNPSGGSVWENGVRKKPLSSPRDRKTWVFSGHEKCQRGKGNKNLSNAQPPYGKKATV